MQLRYEDRIASFTVFVHHGTTRFSIMYRNAFAFKRILPDFRGDGCVHISKDCKKRNLKGKMEYLLSPPLPGHTCITAPSNDVLTWIFHDTCASDFCLRAVAKTTYRTLLGLLVVRKMIPSLVHMAFQGALVVAYCSADLTCLLFGILTYIFFSIDGEGNHSKKRERSDTDYECFSRLQNNY